MEDSQSPERVESGQLVVAGGGGDGRLTTKRADIVFGLTTDWTIRKWVLTNFYSGSPLTGLLENAS